jgi:RND family efflux transporter MFP subunit
MKRPPFCTVNARFFGILQGILSRAFFTTKSTKIAKKGLKIREDSFMFFMSFVVKCFAGCGQAVRCVLTGALVLMFVVTGCQDKVKPGTANVKRPPVSGVQTQTVRPAVVDEYYETSGTVKAKTISVVASRVMGTVTALRVKEGDRVAVGQELLVLDDRDSAQRLKAAEAGYREAVKAQDSARQNKSLLDKTRQRYQGLHEGKAISQQEMDQIETQKRVADNEFERAQAVVVRAQTGVSEAQVQHGFARITAPISGIVTQKKIEVGSMAVPGAPLLTVEDASSFELEIHADESLAGKLAAGMPVAVVMDSIPRPIAGSIREVVPAVDPLSRTFQVKIGVPAEGMKSGLYARIKIPIGRKEVVLLPEAAIVQRGQLTGVYKVNAEGVVVFGLIKAGKQTDREVEILSGIKPGDRVITAGVEKAVDGGVIREEPKN